jgi:hypothetical protein
LGVSPRSPDRPASPASPAWPPVGFLGNVYKGALWLVGGIAFDFACPEKMTNDK